MRGCRSKRVGLCDSPKEVGAMLSSLLIAGEVRQIQQHLNRADAKPASLE